MSYRGLAAWRTLPEPTPDGPGFDGAGLRHPPYDGGMLWALLAVFVVLFIALPLIGIAAWALISAAVTGLIIGGLARLVVPGTRGLGILPTVLLGLVGSIAGGFIGDHVLDVGGLLTVLLEVGVAAVAVASFANHRRRVKAADDRYALGPF